MRSLTVSEPESCCESQPAMTSKTVDRQKLETRRQGKFFRRVVTVDQLSRWLARQQVNRGRKLAWCCYRRFRLKRRVSVFLFQQSVIVGCGRVTVVDVELAVLQVGVAHKNIRIMRFLDVLVEGQQ